MTTPKVMLRHRTTYRFDRPVLLGPHLIRLHPSPAAPATLISYAMEIRPNPAMLHWIRDPLANRLARVSFDGATEGLQIDVDLGLELTQQNPFDFVMDAAAASWPFTYPVTIARELAPYAERPAMQPWLAATLAGLALERQSPVALLVALNQRVHERIHYITRMEPGVLEPEQTVERGSGSCRDVAWLLVQTARSLGFAARFVSGYLVQLVDAAAPTSGVDADTADLHAWSEVFLPGAGWIGFDATSGLITGAGHVALASGAHPDSAAPVSGTTTEAISHLDTTMQVSRL